MDRSRRHARGFTFIELAAVMIIAAVLAVVAAGSLRTLDDSRGVAAAREIQRDVMFARDRAMATGLIHWVVFTPDKNNYAVLAEDPDAPGRAGALTIKDPSTRSSFLKVIGAEAGHVTAITSIAFDTGNEVGFDRLGRPIVTNGSALASDGTVILVGGASVIVEAATGMVRYEAP